MDDGYKQALDGLLRKRGELTSEVDGLRHQLSDKLAALDHIDAAIRVIKPDIDIEDLPERPAPPPNAAFRGEVQRFLLHTLRHAPEPMTTFQLTEEVMRSRHLNTADRVLLRLIAKRTGHSLTRLRRQGWVASERYSKGAELQWWLTAKPEIGPSGEWRNGSGS